MWCYDPKSQKWSEVHGFGKKPSARRRHTAVCIGSQVDVLPVNPSQNPNDDFRFLYREGHHQLQMIYLLNMIWFRRTKQNSFKIMIRQLLLN